MNRTGKDERLWTLPFIMVLVLNFFSSGAGQMSYPLVAKFSLSLGADLKTASTAAGLMSLASLFVCPFAGLLSDRFSRRRILLISFIGYAVCLLAHLLARSIPFLIFLRLATGVFFSICSVTAVAFSTAFIPKKHTGEGLGYASLAMILAQAVGPGLGLSLAERFGYGTCFLIAGLCAVVCLFITTGFPADTAPAPTAEPSQKHSFRLDSLFAPQLFCFMLLAVLFSSASGMITTYLAILAEERQIAGIGLFFTVYSVCMVIVRPFVGKMFDRKGAYILLFPALAFTAAGMILIGCAMSLTLMLCAAVFKAIGQGAGNPSIQAHAIRMLGRERSGVAVSTVQIGMNIGNAFGPIAGSFFVEAWGYQSMFSGFGVLLFVTGCLLTWIQLRSEKKNEPLHDNEYAFSKAEDEKI